jgi:hypothetical protein
MDEFGFQGMKKTLGDSHILTVAFTTYTFNTMLLE